MSTFSLNEFISVVGRGLSKPNRFEVIITSPPVLGGTPNRLVSIMAESTQLPPTRINTVRQQIFGPPSFLPQNADYGGENLSITFNLDREMAVKQYFDQWIDGIANRATGTISYQSNYVAQGMHINQLDEQDNIMYTATFTDIFPIAVNPVQLDANMTNQASKLNVTFSYRRWLWTGVQAGVASEFSPGAQIPELRANTPNSNEYFGSNIQSLSRQFFN